MINLRIDSTQGRPRCLFLGEEQHSAITRALFDGRPVYKHDHLETYGFGSHPRRYDHWVPAHQKDAHFASDVFIHDPARQHALYEFDAVFLNLSSWRLGIDRGIFHSCPDPLSLLTWACDRLITGGIMVLTGDNFLFTQLSGAISYRLEHVWAVRQAGQTDVFVLGRKKPATAGDTELRTLLAGLISGNASFLSPMSPEYVLTCNKPLGPTMFSRIFNRHYIARHMSKVPPPFEMIRHHFAEKGTERKIRIPIKPTLGNIPKLVPVVHDVVTDDAGIEWVVKGIPETVTIKDPDDASVTRDLKRLQMVAIQVHGPEVGSIIKSQIG